MRLIDADAMIADLLTVNPQYETMIKWCCTVVDAQPTIEPKQADDLISRADAVKAVNTALFPKINTAKDAEKAIEAIPSAQPKMGKWLGYNADDEDWLRTDGTPIFLMCDQCNGVVMNNGSAYWNYCPNCGARMNSPEKPNNCAEQTERSE